MKAQIGFIPNNDVQNVPDQKGKSARIRPGLVLEREMNKHNFGRGRRPKKYSRHVRVYVDLWNLIKRYGDRQFIINQALEEYILNHERERDRPLPIRYHEEGL